jgi:outer membrane protein OmpA-like peptidoglycan-associated protein
MTRIIGRIRRMDRAVRVRRGIGAGVLLSLGLVALVASGCASSQKQAMAREQMERARKSYAEAKANPDVEAYAPLPFLDAGKAFQAAERAADDDGMLQLGYIAERKAAIAMAVAEGKLAERDIGRLNLETAEIVAQKRGQEAKRAQAEAERARSEAELARSEAERALDEAQKSRNEAERSRLEAGKALSDAEQARAAAAIEATRAAKAKQEAEQARLAALAEAEKATRAKSEAEQLMRELSELKARQTDRGIVLTIGDVLFATGKATLSIDANRSVDKLSEFLKKYTSRNVLIEGHTDSVGSDELNLALSQQRADSVKERLVANGVDASRITTVGYGKKYPAASNDTAAGKQLNRRVEVIVLNEGIEAGSQMRQ